MYDRTLEDVPIPSTFSYDSDMSYDYDNDLYRSIMEPEPEEVQEPPYSRARYNKLAELHGYAPSRLSRRVKGHRKRGNWAGLKDFVKVCAGTAVLTSEANNVEYRNGEPWEIRPNPGMRQIDVSTEAGYRKFCNWAKDNRPYITHLSPSCGRLGAIARLFRPEDRNSDEYQHDVQLMRNCIRICW